MKYLIQFPISIICDLHCSYCFHTEAFELELQNKKSEKYYDKRPFTIHQYIDWRNKYLSDGEEFLCELHGGECSYNENKDDVCNIIDTLDKEKFQLQTNGLGEEEFYNELVKRKDKIFRLGFTFHRDVIINNSDLVNKFKQNVMFCKENGLNVYVKELLIKKYREDIIENKKYWKELEIDFHIQDFKGYGRGKTFEEYNKYTNLDKMLINNEYKHYGYYCSCKEGYKNVIIRGFDIFAGDVLACWDDPCVVGNINEDWYNGDYKICNNKKKGCKEVLIENKIYRGNYPKDVWTPEVEKQFENLKIDDFKKKEIKNGN